MLIRRLPEAAPFVAGDGALLREILHPDKLAVELGYSLAWAKVKKGTRTHAHILEHCEVYHIIKGQGRMHINDDAEQVNPTDTIYIPPGAIQYIENTGKTDLEFLCIVDPAWQPDIESIVKDRQ